MRIPFHKSYIETTSVWNEQDNVCPAPIWICIIFHKHCSKMSSLSLSGPWGGPWLVFLSWGGVQRPLKKYRCVSTGDFLPFSRGRISAPFPIKNSHLFSPIQCLFSPIKKAFFFLLFLEPLLLMRATMTHIRMILKHLCLSGMLGIIQSKITWFWGYILLPLFSSMSLNSPNFDV